ncbi:MAG TPA: ATP-binding protein [Candidatus Acidoferrales bacterium]|nr:ATP-binding protein [Candidatus Acidoferrales bacterium]
MSRTAAIASAAAAAALLALWCFVPRVPPVPQRPLRIGFEENPPVQVRAGTGYSGLGVEIVREAARRSGIRLQWIETGTSSEAALRRGLVDLWPLMVDLPERRKYIHFARPWMHSSYVLVLREGDPTPARNFRGRIAVYPIPLHVRLAHQRFPGAQIVESPALHGVLAQLCSGSVAAGLFEARMGQSELREAPPECASAALRIQTIPGMPLQAGVASTFEAAGAADRIQIEIGNMFQDGTLAGLIAKYSYFGLDDTWASYEQLAAEQRWHWLVWTILGIVFASGVALWLAASLRQRKRAEAVLRESEERFRNLANTAPVMIVASGPDGHSTFFNKTWLDFTGRSLEQELGYGWLENVHPADRERARASYSSSLAARGACRMEYRLRRADGQYRYIMCTGVPRLEPDGAFGGYIASCLDLTDMKLAQEEAAERQNLESLGVLAGGIAHDFNNLLGGTLAYSELAQLKIEEGIPPADELRQIREVALRGSEIVRQLMIFAGKEGGTLEPLDISSVAGEMLELLKVSISKRAVLQTDLREDLPPVFGNAAQIRQVVMNLITNASEAIGDRDGVIRVRTERITAGTATLVRLEVSDDGCGMTPETQRRAFDPFFTTKFAGRGMGLAVVQRIVRGLGGSIQVQSAPGSGTTIKVTLPCAADILPAKKGRAARFVLQEPQPLAGRSILVVEDEPSLLAAVSKTLQRRGFSVIQAGDGTAALEVIRSLDKPIDVMLLDVTLPGASSREVFEEAGRLRPSLLPIVTSAYSRESALASFPGIAVEHFIRKPFRVTDLVNLLQDNLVRKAGSHPCGG